ncbi:hypothetical protein CWB65_19420, partial [Pseudoalteromonas sp. S554]
ELEEEPELLEEPALEEELEPNEVLEDFGADDFTDTSDTLLDPEDLLDEYNDDALQSVDELLNELQQPEDSEYVESPDWTLDDLDDEIEEVEVDLGDDPLAEDTDSDLSLEDEILETESITPSEELEDYPELEIAEDQGAETQESTSNEGENVVSQTEKDLADSISKGADLSNFDEELDDEPHATADFDEAPIIDDNELLAVGDAEEFATKEEHNELGDDGEFAKDVSDFSDNDIDVLADEELDSELSPSQTEQELSQALSSSIDLNSLEDDFDDEPLIDCEFEHADS